MWALNISIFKSLGRKGMRKQLTLCKQDNFFKVNNNKRRARARLMPTSIQLATLSPDPSTS